MSSAEEIYDFVRRNNPEAAAVLPPEMPEDAVVEVNGQEVS